MDLSTTQAAQVIGVTPKTIYNYVERGTLIARREGYKRRIRIKERDLRDFASQYGFTIDEEVINGLEK